jgi:hypothetical protein
MTSKFFSLLATTAIVYSCQSNQSYSVIGTWALQNEVNKTGEPFSSKAIFKADSLFIETIVNGQKQDVLSVPYQLTPDKKYLLTATNLKEPFRFEILKLTNEQMELKEVASNRIEKYKRVKG